MAVKNVNLTYPGTASITPDVGDGDWVMWHVTGPWTPGDVVVITIEEKGTGANRKRGPFPVGYRNSNANRRFARNRGAFVMGNQQRTAATNDLETGEAPATWKYSVVWIRGGHITVTDPRIDVKGGDLTPPPPPPATATRKK